MSSTKRNPVARHGRASECVRAGNRNASEVTANVTAKQGHLLAEFAEHRDRLEVWICLHQLLDRLKARVGDALDSYEHDLEWNQDLVDELKAEVNRFTTLAAHLRRRRS
jgi:hypothetical protein